MFFPFGLPRLLLWGALMGPTLITVVFNGWWALPGILLLLRLLFVPALIVRTGEVVVLRLVPIPHKIVAPLFWRYDRFGLLELQTATTVHKVWLCCEIGQGMNGVNQSYEDLPKAFERESIGHRT